MDTHWDMKGYMGMVTSLGKGAVMNAFRAQKDKYSEFHGVRTGRYRQHDPQNDVGDVFFGGTGIY